MEIVRDHNARVAEHLIINEEQLTKLFNELKTIGDNCTSFNAVGVMENVAIALSRVKCPKPIKNLKNKYSLVLLRQCDTLYNEINQKDINRQSYVMGYESAEEVVDLLPLIIQRKYHQVIRANCI